jgi:hypothetical protein
MTDHVTNFEPAPETDLQICYRLVQNPPPWWPEELQPGEANIGFVWMDHGSSICDVRPEQVVRIVRDAARTECDERGWVVLKNDRTCYVCVYNGARILGRGPTKIAAMVAALGG